MRQGLKKDMNVSVTEFESVRWVPNPETLNPTHKPKIPDLVQGTWEKMGKTLKLVCGHFTESFIVIDHKLEI